MPASTPPSGGGMLSLVQVPVSAPGGTMQVTPAQQSPVDVQGPPSDTQLPPSVPTPHLSWPVASGTQGSPPQHSPLKVQLPPDITHMPPSFRLMALQRGMPLLSSWQHSLPEMQAQQSLRSLELEQA